MFAVVNPFQPHHPHRSQVRVLDALSFHLVVWHPFHPMHAFLNDVYSSLAGNDAQVCCCCLLLLLWLVELV